MHITAQGPRLRNDLYCVEWDVKLYYTIPYRAACDYALPHVMGALSIDGRRLSVCPVSDPKSRMEGVES